MAAGGGLVPSHERLERERMKVEPALERNQLTMVGVRFSLARNSVVSERFFFLSLCAPLPAFGGPWVFYYDSMASVLAFPGLAYFALRYRHSPGPHKRLILLATLVIAEAGIARWPVHWIHAIPCGVSTITHSFLLLLVFYDFYSRRKIHPATLWGGAFLVLYEETQSLIGHSQAWRVVALWILHLWPKSG
jgi:hypothetical protein